MINIPAIMEENNDLEGRHNEHECTTCKRSFRTVRGLNQHQRCCLKSSSGANKLTHPPPINVPVNDTEQHTQSSNDMKKTPDSPLEPPPVIDSVNGTKQLLYKWGIYNNDIFEKHLSVAYERIVYWRKNLFMLPTGKVGKRYIGETTRLMNA